MAEEMSLLRRKNIEAIQSFSIPEKAELELIHSFMEADYMISAPIISEQEVKGKMQTFGKRYGYVDTVMDKENLRVVWTYVMNQIDEDGDEGVLRYTRTQLIIFNWDNCHYAYTCEYDMSDDQNNDFGGELIRVHKWKVERGDEENGYDLYGAVIFDKHFPDSELLPTHVEYFSDLLFPSEYVQD